MTLLKNQYPALELMKNYWFILVFIASIIIGWTNIQSEITGIRRDAKANDDGNVRIEANQNEMLLEIRTLNQVLLGTNGSNGMQGDVSALKNDVEDIKIELVKQSKDK